MTRRGAASSIVAKRIIVAAAVVLAGGAAEGRDIVRTPLVGSDFPISAAVTVPQGADTIYLSGMLPPVIDKDAPKGSVAAYGDTEAQTEGALQNIQKTLERLGLGFGDVVKMTIFMVGDPAQGGAMDFAGMMASYKKHFGTDEQPNKPARSAVQVAALAAPGALIEIEVIAAKPR